MPHAKNPKTHHHQKVEEEENKKKKKQKAIALKNNAESKIKTGSILHDRWAAVEGWRDDPTSLKPPSPLLAAPFALSA